MAWERIDLIERRIAILEVQIQRLQRTLRLTDAIVLQQHRSIQQLHRQVALILWKLDHQHDKYALTLTLENNMADGIIVGQSGTVLSTYTDNGNPVPLPYPNPIQYNSSDPSVTLTPSADSTTCTVAVPAGDASTQVVISASVQNSDGTITNSNALSIPILPVPQQFVLTLSLQQASS